MTLEIGESERLEAEFADVDGVAADPSQVVLTITAPSGTVTTITSPNALLHNPSVGYWYYDVVTTESGVWTYRFEGTSGILAGTTGTFTVEPLPGVSASRLPADGPCGSWISWPDASSCCRHDLDAITDGGIRTQILESATFVVWALSGKKYPGLCTATRSFCAPCAPCRCVSRCRCGPDSRIDLGTLYPVASVTQVLVDGVPLIEGTDYRVDDWRYVVRLDSKAWPAIVDLTDPEELQVTWAFGRQPLPGLKHAAELLVCELAAPCIPNATCNFPQRITAMSAEGVTYTLVDPTAIINAGKTGIFDIDLLIFAANLDTPSAGGIFDPGAHGQAIATDTGHDSP